MLSVDVQVTSVTLVVTSRTTPVKNGSTFYN